MAVKPIRLFGDPVLRTPAEPVKDFDKELRKLVKDLTDTMIDASGAGLAAPQLGVSLRVLFSGWGSPLTAWGSPVSRCDSAPVTYSTLANGSRSPRSVASRM